MNPKLKDILKQLEKLTEDVCVYIRFFSDGSWGVMAWDEHLFDKNWCHDEQYQPYRQAILEVLANDT